MQSDISVKKISFLSTVNDCLNKEGLKGFFKGMSFPLYSVPLVNAVVFSFHEVSKKLLGFEDESEMNIHEGVICGALAGLANCVVVTPVELVKVRLQIQQGNQASAYYKGVSDCLKKTIHKDGIKGLYRGNVATILREVPAYSAQFGGYYFTKRLISKYKKKHIDDLSNLDLMISGAAGGYMCWQFSYPQDVIKTLLQTSKNQFKITYKDGGFFHCANDLYLKQGIRGFWSGFLPCSLRALIANAVLFVTYENCKQILLLD